MVTNTPLPLFIENPKGSTRHWYDEAGQESGSTPMQASYGYVKHTLGLDGDEVDVYVGLNRESTRVFVITQMLRPEFTEVDEQKCFLYFQTPEQVLDYFFIHYNDPRFFGDIEELDIQEFWDQCRHRRGRLLRGRPIRTLLDDKYKATIDWDKHMPDHDEVIKSLEAVSARTREVRDQAKASFEALDKALKASAFGSAAARARREFEIQPYRAGVAMETLPIGTSRVQDPCEPPFVPTRVVETPNPLSAATYTNDLKSCQVCSVIHKSHRTCPKCDRAGSIREAKRHWG